MQTTMDQPVAPAPALSTTQQVDIWDRAGRYIGFCLAPLPLPPAFLWGQRVFLLEGEVDYREIPDATVPEGAVPIPPLGWVPQTPSV